MSIYKTAYRAKKNLQAGQTVDRDDFELVPSYETKGGDATLSIRPTGLVLQQPLEKGQYFSTRNFILEKIHAGKRLRLLYRKGGVHVTLQGTLKKSARVGEVASFHANLTGNEFLARITSNEAAEVITKK